MAKNKEILKSKRALMDLPSVKSAKLIETHNSSVTTAWGVNWRKIILQEIFCKIFVMQTKKISIQLK